LIILKTLPIVQTKKGNLLASDAVFIDPLLLNDEVTFDSIFKLVDFFWSNTPIKDLTKEWTSIISEWKLEEITYISYKDFSKRN
jgi:hypothetical protein